MRFFKSEIVTGICFPVKRERTIPTCLHVFELYGDSFTSVWASPVTPISLQSTSTETLNGGGRGGLVG